MFAGDIKFLPFVFEDEADGCWGGFNSTNSQIFLSEGTNFFSRNNHPRNLPPNYFMKIFQILLFSLWKCNMKGKAFKAFFIYYVEKSHNFFLKCALCSLENFNVFVCCYLGPNSDLLLRFHKISCLEIWKLIHITIGKCCFHIYGWN